MPRLPIEIPPPTRSPLTRYERELGLAVASVPAGLGVGTWRWDIATRTIHWSEELRRIYGMAETDRAPVTLQAFADLVHPADRGRVIATVSETLSSLREGHAHRFRILRRDGGVRLVVDEAGRAIALEGVDVDLSSDPDGPVVEPPGSHRAIFDAIDDGFCLCEMIVDDEGRARDYRFLETNALFEEMTGIVAAVGRTALELVPDLEPHWVETYARAGLERRTLRFEQGSEAMGRWFDVFATPVEPHGRFAIVFRDITAERNAERALIESEARFRNIADHSPSMIWVTREDGSCVFLNEGWFRFTGQSEETGLGFGWLDAVHPDDRAHVKRAFSEANARGETFSIEYRLRRADGVHRWAIDSARPRLSPEGRFLGYVGTVIDITERREAEAALAASEARARALFDHVGVSLWDEDFSAILDRLEALRAQGVVDLSAHLAQRPQLVRELMDVVVLRDVNRFTLRLFEADDKAGFLASLSRVFPEGAEDVFVKELEALWRGERFVQIEGPLCTFGGRPFEAMFTIVFEGERAQRTLVSVVDVSALKRLEQRQQTLIAELNHRVKNSLAMVQAIALQTFRHSHGPQTRETFMARLQALGKAQDLLTRTRWDAAPLDALIAEIVAPYDTGCAFVPQGPRVTIDPQQVLTFALVLHELCTNAVKYGAGSVPGGRVDIAWELRKEGSERHLRLVWTERGGPPVTPPTRTGFGSRLIARLTPHVRFDYAREGLVCVLDVRLDG